MSTKHRRTQDITMEDVNKGESRNFPKNSRVRGSDGRNPPEAEAKC